jgi:hypothetical protein
MTASQIFQSLCGGSSARGWPRSAGVIALSLVIVASGACSDSNVPFFTQPTSIESTPGGIQNGMTGLFAASRIDVGTYVYWMPMFARDEAQIWIDNPQNVQFGTGLTPIPNGSGGVWDNEYRAAAAAVALIAAIPKTSPAYTAQQTAALIGVAQTLEAVNFMEVAETRDTLGIPLHPATGTTVGPVFCAKDAWAQIVALLDSANDSLNSAGATPIPVGLPPGFGAVSGTAGPSTVAGSFASLNRALAAKAGLQLAYAIARSSPGTSPTPTLPGTPDATALTRADSAAVASALINIPLTPPTPGPFAPNNSGVYWDFSAASGDVGNPISAFLGTWRTLSYVTADVDTVHDQRFLNKFVANSNPLQIPVDAFMNTNWLFSGYSTIAAAIPLIRNESLVLYRAQIQLGLGGPGNLATAISLINQVHQQAGGFASPLTIASTYTAVRDTLLKEQRISTIFEGSGDRNISIRMYNLATTVDTTWSSAAAIAATGAAGQTDLHTTVIPIPASEVEGRGGSYTVTCP